MIAAEGAEATGEMVSRCFTRRVAVIIDRAAIKLVPKNHVSVTIKLVASRGAVNPINKSQHITTPMIAVSTDEDEGEGGWPIWANWASPSNPIRRGSPFWLFPDRPLSPT